MNSRRVLVIGGRGYFGKLLVDDLLRHADCNVIVASRQQFDSSGFETVVADLHDVESLVRALADVDVAICAAGPYRTLPTTLVEMCLARGIHYIDLADDRGFVEKVRELARQNQSSRNVVCSGWSTVPALTGLLVRIACAGMKAIESIQIHMAPGNRSARQAATIASLMQSVGQPFMICRNGKWQQIIGWSDPRDFAFPAPVGKRRGYLIDVPDHEIFPELFGARTVEFRVGSEVPILNGCLSLLRQTGRNWVSWSGLFQRAAALLSWIGHDWGAVGVEVSGEMRRKASVVADSHAERIAVMPACIVTGALLSAVHHREYSYDSWLTEGELRIECERRGFRLVVE